MSRLSGAAVPRLGAAALLLTLSTSTVVIAAPHPPASASKAHAFAWLRPGPAPADWRQVTLPSGAAALSVPPTWVDLAGDKGTATAAPPGPRGYLQGYLNATPRQGGERLHGFARFRVSHHREEGAHNVRMVAAAEGLHLRSAHGSCVIDDYDSRVGSHRYREIACIAKGARATTVVIAAAPLAQWSQSAPLLERAVSYANFG